MADIFLLSDHHFGHSSIIKFVGADGKLIRPGFSCIEEMNELIIQNHNKVVKPGSKVYFGGDMGRRFAPLLKRMNGRKRLILGNHDCVDSATQCLTKRGWLNYDEITLDDMVLSKVDSNHCEWSHINDILIKPFIGIMKKNSFKTDMCVTPNHRVLLTEKFPVTARQKRRAGNVEDCYILAKDVTSEKNQQWAIPVSAFSLNEKTNNFSDDEVFLFGLLLTDCHISKSRDHITIYQCKPNNVILIRNLLERLGISFTEKVRNRSITEICGKKLKKPNFPEHNFHLNVEMTRNLLNKFNFLHKTIVPNWCMELPTKQFTVLLDSLIFADGTWDGAHPEKKNCATLYGAPEFLSAIQSIAVQHGWRSNINIDNRGHSVLRLSKTGSSSINGGFEDIDYDGIVWCLSVPYSNFMVRRNGFAFFTGNCDLSREELVGFDKILSWRYFGNFSKRFVVSHYPLHPMSFIYRGSQRDEATREWKEGREPNCYNVHGHIHEKLVMRTDVPKMVDTRYYNICCEHQDYTPIHVEDLIKKLGKPQTLRNQP